MTNWIRQQLKGKLFRKVFLATLVSSIIPIGVMILFLFRSEFSTNDFQSRFSPQFFIIMLLAFFLAGIIAFFLSRHISAPISAVTKSATEIARGNFSHEVKVKSNDEIGRMARLFNYMTIELRRLDNMNLAKIIAERNKTQTIIKNIADAVIVTDPDSNILLLNACAELWFGLKEGETTNKPLAQIIKEPRLTRLIADAAFGSDPAPGAVEINVKVPGEWKPRILQARAARVLQDDNELIGIVSILRDITQQKEMDKMKTELVSMVAHELRSPLTSISGFSELLLDADITRDQSEEYAQIILKESNRLGELINKFLDISRIESGRIQPKKSNIDLLETVQIVVGNNSYIASRRGIHVEIHTTADNYYVTADSGMMEQVFLNLFTNAIKYSHDKTRIDIVLRQNDNEVIAEVHDQGFGMPEEALTKIFDKFFRVTDDEKVRETTGSGLGLSLVKQIIEMHEGRIGVESELGHGSVFSVSLPRAKKHETTIVSHMKDSEEIIR